MIFEWFSWRLVLICPQNSNVTCLNRMLLQLGSKLVSCWWSDSSSPGNQADGMLWTKIVGSARAQAFPFLCFSVRPFLSCHHLQHGSQDAKRNSCQKASLLFGHFCLPGSDVCFCANISIVSIILEQKSIKTRSKIDQKSIKNRSEIDQTLIKSRSTIDQKSIKIDR